MVRQFRSLVTADWKVNPFRADRATLAIWRLGQAAHGRPGAAAFVVRRVHDVLDVVWTRALVGAELPRSAQAGPGLRLPHSGRGVVLHPSVRLGSRVTLYHRVTLGVRGSGSPPVVGDDVYLGCGAVVAGPVLLGDGCFVGANAVVVKDVPPGRTAVGVPAHRSRPSVDA